MLVREKDDCGLVKGQEELSPLLPMYRSNQHYNLPGNKLHDTFERMLKGLSFQPHQIRFIVETAKNLLIQPLQLKREKHQQQLKDLQALNKKIYQFEEEFMNNEIETETYQRWFKKLKVDKALIEYALGDGKKSKLGTTDGIAERVLPELSNLFQIYDKDNIIQKHTLIKGVFKDNLAWGGEGFRTTFIDPIFNDNLLRINKKRTALL